MKRQPWFYGGPNKQTERQLTYLNTVVDNIGHVFIWADAPEGHEYWSDVASKLCAMREELRAYVERPKTMTVERWHVEGWDLSSGTKVQPLISREMADATAKRWRDGGMQCVRVTGPHQHEVPA